MERAAPLKSERGDDGKRRLLFREAIAGAISLPFCCPPPHCASLCYYKTRYKQEEEGDFVC